MLQKIRSSTLVIATYNVGKLKEISALLAPYGVEEPANPIAEAKKAIAEGRNKGLVIKRLESLGYNESDLQ